MSSPYRIDSICCQLRLRLPLLAFTSSNLGMDSRNSIESLIANLLTNFENAWIASVNASNVQQLQGQSPRPLPVDLLPKDSVLLQSLIIETA